MLKSICDLIKFAIFSKLIYANDIILLSKGFDREVTASIQTTYTSL